MFSNLQVILDILIQLSKVLDGIDKEGNEVISEDDEEEYDDEEYGSEDI